MEPSETNQEVSHNDKRETVRELIEVWEELKKRKQKIESKIDAVEGSIEIFLDDLGGNLLGTEAVLEIASANYSSVAQTVRAVLEQADEAMTVNEAEAIVQKFHDDVRKHYASECLSRMHRNGEAERVNPRTYVSINNSDQ